MSADFVRTSAYVAIIVFVVEVSPFSFLKHKSNNRCGTLYVATERQQSSSRHAGRRMMLSRSIRLLHSNKALDAARSAGLLPSLSLSPSNIQNETTTTTTSQLQQYRTKKTKTGSRGSRGHG
eukprot:8533993-Ditylum_brightwellii.AAC.1